MAAVAQPVFIKPKKRTGKKGATTVRQVDHIITVQGAETDITKIKNGVSSPVAEHVVNGMIHSTMEGLKSNMKINLPVITDENDEEAEQGDAILDSQVDKNGYQALANNSHEADLSPIYENSSDACSSYDELDDAKDFKTPANNESSTATLNSNSLTQSDKSLHPNSQKNSMKRKKTVNISTTEANVPDMALSDLKLVSTGFTADFTSMPKTPIGVNENYLTMRGTMQSSKGDNDSVDVKLNISREELEKLRANLVAEQRNKFDLHECSLKVGFHIFLLSLLVLPIVVMTAFIKAFYVGTVTWYNIFTQVTEDNTWKKVILSPIMVLSYPFLIVIISICLSLYAGFSQLTFNSSIWLREIDDVEKGFFAWVCSILGYPECSPYDVVVLTELKV